MTDNEIVKALECCYGEYMKCDECPLEVKAHCVAILLDEAHDFVKRQQEEIKILKQNRANIFEIVEAVERGRTKGIKEITAKIVRQLAAEINSSDKYIREYDGSLPQIAWNNGLRKALEIVKGVQNE